MAAQIGEILIEMGVLSAPDLDRALRAQRERGGRLGTILRNLGLVSDADWAKALSLKTGFPLAAAGDYPAMPLYNGQISEKFLRESRVVPLAQTAGGLALAMADPLDSYAIEAMELVAGCMVLPHVGAERDIDNALERLYREASESLDDIVEDLGDPDLAAGEDDIERLKDMASEAPVVRLVNLILARAMESRASDIHIEPYENRLSVRYRIDGILREVESPSPRLASAIVSRIKIMANLNIAERRLAQDGRIRVRMQGKELDLRVSTLPTLNGESVVMRLLEQDSVALDLSALGYSDENQAKLHTALGHHHGILLVTGPTGSGKTTTLYAALTHLNTPERKIITVEDPIEYQIGGITQIQVNAKIGLSFANVLRSIVRHDPDVILVGETRDRETAEIAVQSALTGHLVLSTLHTNDAAGALTRLMDMGVEEYLLTSTVNAVVGQRLVRTLCPACRQPYHAPDELKARLKVDTADAVTLYRGEGCEACNGLGYTGRIGITEVMPMTDTLRDLVLRRADARTLQQTAVAEGMTTMFEDGLHKALHGVTSIEEVRRVTRDA
ncbi:MAG: type II secretion system ATPase GspE [Rhodobacterales bacterium]|nr:type II secretion system ATPase GspE [Rhodobacterales bacterium]